MNKTGLHAMVNAPLREEIYKISRQKKISVSQLVEKALEEFLQKQGYREMPPSDRYHKPRKKLTIYEAKEIATSYKTKVEENSETLARKYEISDNTVMSYVRCFLTSEEIAYCQDLKKRRGYQTASLKRSQAYTQQSQTKREKGEL